MRSRQKHRSRGLSTVVNQRIVASIADSLPVVAKAGAAISLTWRVGADFSLQGVGAASSSGGLTISRTFTDNAVAVNNSTTHDLSAGTVTTGLANDTLRIAKTAAGTRGALIEPTRTNYIASARSFSTWTVSLTTRTLNATNGPDGTNGAARMASTSTPGNVSKSATTPDGYPYIFSAWYKSPSGAKQTQIGTSRNAVLAYAIVNEVDTKWTRAAVVNSSVFTGALSCVISDARSRAANGGLGTALRDDFVDLPQLEQGQYPTSWMPTSTTAVVRSADALSVALTTARAASGKVRFYARVEVPWNATTYQENAAPALLYFWRAGSFHSAYLDSATTLRVQAYDPVGNAYVTSSASQSISLSPGDILEILIDVGGNAPSSAKWRINGGATVVATMTNVTPLTVPTSGMGAASGTVSVLHDGSGTQVFSGVFDKLGFVDDASNPF